MEFHPLTDGLKRMKEGDLFLLAEDIKKNGQKDDIILFEGKIIDGRERYDACQIAGVPPRFREGTPEDMVSVILRKSPSSDQKAMIATRFTLTAEEARERKIANLPDMGNSHVGKLGRQEAALKFGVDHKRIAFAQRVREAAEEKDPDIPFDVEIGKLSLKDAAVMLGLEVPQPTRRSRATTQNLNVKTAVSFLKQQIEDDPAGTLAQLEPLTKVLNALFQQTQAKTRRSGYDPKLSRELGNAMGL